MCKVFYLSPVYNFTMKKVALKVKLSLDSLVSINGNYI